MTTEYRSMHYILDRLVPTAHVLCPDCKTETLGPYHDEVTNEYFDGHYCEDCGRTWHWRKSDDPTRNGFVAY
jgi:hypothetical protein